MEKDANSRRLNPTKSMGFKEILLTNSLPADPYAKILQLL
jgi:hypothetical protein